MKHQKSTSSLLINESPLLVLPSLAVKAGLNEALILQQVHYWISNPKAGIDHEGRRWVWNTIKDWKEQFPFWSEKTISRAMHSAKQQGFLLCEKLSKDSWDKTMHYSIDYDALNSDNAPKSLIHSIGTDCPNRYGQIVPIDRDRLTASIGTDCPYLYSTETSSETSSETSLETTPKNQQQDNHPEVSAEPPPAQRKSTSLPDDWSLPVEWMQWALSEKPNWTEQHANKVAEIFADYWRGKSGKDARKADWLATWRNWVRRENSSHHPKNATSATTERSSGINNPPPPRYLN